MLIKESCPRQTGKFTAKPEETTNCSEEIKKNIGSAGKSTEKAEKWGWEDLNPRSHAPQACILPS